MRTFWTYCLTIIVLAANSNPAVGGRLLVLPREETASKAAPSTVSTPPPSSAASQSAVSITDSSAVPSSQIESASSQESDSGNETASATSPDPSTSGVVIGPTPTPFNGSINGSITNLPHIEGLPIHPEVTPALAVAGALLILTGAFYTIIGIKTKWLHIFCSATYLFALCVTILIIYVMHPPVSNAVQGAYFVAAAVTGLIFGAIAVVFADVTEGLGCFLGGFCLGMWFLTLKPGGLITSTAGKSIFIACFTVGIFGLYISHYTRPYGLIGSTSFAGATAVLLGVDVFSRAGLKEFWLYIWNLNNGLFPLHYDGPYPITRGIRVEIAGIILLCILGVMSQMKVWNIIKKRREEKATEERRKALERDQAEEELGKKLEEGNDRDMQMWDAVYGKKSSTRSQVDSGIGTDEPSTCKGSMSVVDVRDLPEGLEMQNLASSKSSQKGGRVVVVHVGQDDEIVAVRPDGKSVRSVADTSREASIREVRAAVAKSQASETSSIKSSKTTRTIPKQQATLMIDPNLSLKPKVVSPPFKIPDDSASQHSDDKSSIATFAESDRAPERPAKRLSGSALIRKVSGRSKRRSMGRTISEEALVIPYIEEDRVSSVAATLDGVSIHNASQEKLSTGGHSPATSSVKSNEVFATPQQTPWHEEIDLSFGPFGRNAGDTERESTLTEKQTQNPLTGHALGLKPVTKSESPQQLRTQTSLSGNLPDRTSKVVMAYRTNEWAKHLDSAEAPILEEEKLTKPQAEPEETAPVNIQELQQTPLNAEPAPTANAIPEDTASKEQASTPDHIDKASVNPYFKQKSPRISPSAPNLNVTKTVSKSPSRTSLSSNDSNQESSRPAAAKARQSQTPRGFRSSSSPMVSSPLAEEPIEEGVESSFENRFTPSPMHLMSQRDAIIQSKPSSTSLLSPRNGLTRNPSASSSSAALVNQDSDNMPLSHRRSLLQQQHQNGSQTLLSPQRTVSGSSTPVYTHTMTSPMLSRNPSRLSLAQMKSPSQNPSRDSTLSAWRASLASDNAHQNASQNAELEQRRLELLAEKQRAINSKQVAQMQEHQRKSQLDKEMMKRGSAMMDAHREAMRKMQGQVNQGLANRP
ncbi:uncharacterized protein KY384_003854 [Bacidia gigantensis]|uniref:uncharacterized protein n=1 Tax=Bacidia gigantensis TaxID=2732470 RepID=UPI001D039BAC|nr:uncharacterized protein KY384_003854 [Bacidia gigantensis]KAG8532213.1 hypothetical protein KY384_003854 [Bacidia gigantensis]